MLAALRGTKLLVANVGDSRALLAKRHDEMESKVVGRPLKCEQLTTDHKASLAEEVNQCTPQCLLGYYDNIFHSYCVSALGSSHRMAAYSLMPAAWREFTFQRLKCPGSP